MPAYGGSSYDEIPYEGFALFLTYPDHMAALAQLFGVSPPDVDTCRVLELGCARGDNLIPMAVSLPRARFIGIDLSQRQIADGQATIAALGLKNIELRDQSIMDVDSKLGPFDFIVAHGVYSWVADPVREGMLRLCAEALAPNGLAYISFNTYPGWHMRAMIRDMMLFRSRGIADMRDRVEAGRNFMRGLAGLLAKYDHPFARCLSEEAKRIVNHNQSYLCHEFFEDTNEPIYFHQFVDRAAVHRLRYLTDAQYWSTGSSQPAQLFKSLGDTALDWHDREQVFDFVKGRAFRNTILCREELPCSRAPSSRALQSLRITSLVRSAGAARAAGADGDVGENFHNLRGDFAFSTNDPIIRTAVGILDESRPRSIPFEALRTRVEERLATVAGAQDPRPQVVSENFADALLDLFTHNMIELHVHESGFTTEVGDFPRASPYARRQAATGPNVANLRHRMIALVDFDQVVLPYLDGQHDRGALVARMQDAINHHGYAIQAQGRAITDPADAEPILYRLLEESLRRLAAAALLICG